MRLAVIVASNRAAAGIYSDKSGPILAEGFRTQFDVDDPIVVPDGEPVGQALRAALADGVDVIITSGGTGLSSTDLTPEQTRGLLERELPGIAEQLRSYGTRHTPFAALSRGLAGVVGNTLIINLAGSTGAARDGLDVLLPILPHVVDQLHDGDHERESA